MISFFQEKCCGVNETNINEFAASGWFTKIFQARWNSYSNPQNLIGKNATEYYPAACCQKFSDDKELSPDGDQVCNKENRYQQVGFIYDLSIYS